MNTIDLLIYFTAKFIENTELRSPLDEVAAITETPLSSRIRSLDMVYFKKNQVAFNSIPSSVKALFNLVFHFCPLLPPKGWGGH